MKKKLHMNNQLEFLIIHLKNVRQINCLEIEFIFIPWFYFIIM